TATWTKPNCLPCSRPSSSAILPATTLQRPVIPTGDLRQAKRVGDRSDGTLCFLRNPAPPLKVCCDRDSRFTIAAPFGRCSNFFKFMGNAKVSEKQRAALLRGAR